MKVKTIFEFPGFPIRTMMTHVYEAKSLEDATAHREFIKATVQKCLTENKIFYCQDESAAGCIAPGLLNTALIHTVIDV